MDGDGSIRSDERASWSLIPILEGAGGYPKLFRDDLEDEAGDVVVELLVNRGLAANLREAISLTRTGVTNLLSILTKGMVQKYRLDFDAGEFLEELEEIALFCLTHNAAVRYNGLDSARDTEEEVRNLVRAFPTVLSRRDAEGNFPIHELLYLRAGRTSLYRTNLRAISFVPLFAQQAIELELFDEGQRGGLLAKRNRIHDIDTEGSLTAVDTGPNVLQALAGSDGQGRPGEATERNMLVDGSMLAVMKRLVSMVLMTKADIQEHNLLNYLCDERYFAKERFRFLSGWDPHALMKGDRDGDLPLHLSWYTPRTFRSVFEAGVDQFPEGRGLLLLFWKRGDGKTPFELACQAHGSEKVIEAVESALFRHDNRLDAEGALLSAATNEGVSLDGFYFLMRWIGVSLVSPKLPPAATANG